MARPLHVQSQQLLTERQVFKDEVLPGPESADHPPEEMPKQHDHGEDLIRIELCAKAFILWAYGVLARHKASNPVLVHRLASLLRASFRPRLAASVISPLRFAITSRPSRCEEDFHLLAVKHARHTRKRGGSPRDAPWYLNNCREVYELLPSMGVPEQPSL
jgi:hypothetical protein